ncbi:unnamed protein product [Sphenostylis stenocarpa]|uniref:Glycosyltransferase n=1 Tax=Sphenostylis stenocarpa TaxID=92480 RepID=A0AA86VAB1_9FABA|nr:unnamed protein product [Sphenostylis stenocarpa]
MEEMDKKKMARRAHCVVLAYPLQGHINPMLQFSKLLEHQGVRVTLVTTRFYYNNLKRIPPSIALETISDGFDQGGPTHDAEGHKAYIVRSREVGSASLAELLEKLGRSKDDHVGCVVYDAFFPWAQDVAKRFGIVGAVFLTQNMTVNSIYYHVHLGKLRVPLTEIEFSLPAMPKLQLQDMPSFLLTYVEHPYYLDFFVNQFSNIDKADWVLCNTFYELDKEVADWITKIWPKFRNIGPNIPSMFLDKHYKDDQDYGVEQFEDEECLEWLEGKPKESVVYVSFGSLAELGGEQMEEVAYGLKECSRYFLWVVRASEETKLPKDFEKKSEKGLVVTWCSQLRVLAHEAIGCFVTHCGWNSTLETLCLGVPTIAIPHWSDQTTNAKLMADVWKIGIRAPVDENKIVQRETLKHCIREVMENEEGKVLKNNVIRWKTLALRAVAEGGNSYKNIVQFAESFLQ